MADHDLHSVIEMVDSLQPDEQREVCQYLSDKIGTNIASEKDFQRELLSAGLLEDIKPPISDVRPYQGRRRVKIAGKPLSESVVEERR